MGRGWRVAFAVALLARPPGKLHVKCAFADGWAFVGSANRNMDLGLMVREPVSVQALAGMGFIVPGWDIRESCDHPAKQRSAPESRARSRDRGCPVHIIFAK